MRYLHMKYWRIYTLVLLFAVTIAAGCTQESAGPPPDAITIVFSAGTKAELYKCG